MGRIKQCIDELIVPCAVMRGVGGFHIRLEHGTLIDGTGPIVHPGVEGRPRVSACDLSLQFQARGSQSISIVVINDVLRARTWLLTCLPSLLVHDVTF